MRCLSIRIARQALATVLFCLLAGSSYANPSVFADFNGDGREDVAVGVPSKDVNGKADSGAVHVFYGNSVGLAVTNDQVWSQGVLGIQGIAQAGDCFGAALAVGDFNGDGFTDLAIGVPFEDTVGNPDSGKVNVLYGSSSGLAIFGSQLWSRDSLGVQGPEGENFRFGAALAAGDFNGDGKDDLAIGCPGDSPGTLIAAGGINVLFGQNQGLDASGDRLINGSVFYGVLARSNDELGAVLASGDFNRDGRDELLVGDFHAASNQPSQGLNFGRVLVFGGTAGGLSEFVSLVLEQGLNLQDSVEVGDQFGRTLTAGDFNGDGFHDVAIGVPGEEFGDVQNVGAVSIVYGSPGGLSPTAVRADQLLRQGNSSVNGPGQLDDRYGSAVAAGDFNGDGFEDLAVGIPLKDVDGKKDAGAVSVIYGSANGLSATTVLPDQVWSQNSSQLLDGLSAPIEETSEAFDRFGASLYAGTIKFTDRDSLVIGVPSENGFGAIAVLHPFQSFASGNIGLSASVDQLIHENSTGVLGTAVVGDQFGLTLNDTHGDVVVGAGFSGTWLSLSGGLKGAGNGFHYSITGRIEVSNPGGLRAANSIVRFYVSDDESLDGSDLLIDEQNLGPISPGGTRSVTVSARLLTDAAGHFVIAVLDATDVVTEVNEENNIVAAGPLPN